MIQLSYPEPLVQYQACYLSIDEGHTGLHLLSGPHYVSPEGNYVRTLSTSIQAGYLYRDPDACSIGNEHPILHYNATGSVRLSHDMLAPPIAYMQLWPDIHEPNKTGILIGMSDCKGRFGGYNSPSVRGFRVGFPPFSTSYWRANVVYGAYYPYYRYCGFDEWCGNVHYITSLTENSPSSFTYLCKAWDRAGKLVEDWEAQYNITFDPPTRLDAEAGYTVPMQVTRIGHIKNTVEVTNTTATMIPTTPVISITGASIDACRGKIINEADRVYSLDAPSDVPWGTLVKDAVQSIRYIDSNSIENVAGFSDIKSNLPPIRTVKRLITKKDPLALAELFLWYKYSLSPNISDSKEFLNAVRKKSRRYTGAFYRSQVYCTMTQAGSHSVFHECHASVKFAVSDYRDAQMRLASWGFDPGIAQGWDLIPFSFVVDWFFHVGDKLSNLDWEFDNFVNTYNYESLTFSTKSKMSIDMPSPLMGTVSLVRYERIISQSIPFAYAIQSNSASSHILEGGALLVTNLCD